MSPGERSEPRAALGPTYQAASLPKLGFGIVDVHAHINGLEASALWAPIAKAYGVERTFSMSRVEDIGAKDVKIGMRVKFRAHAGDKPEDPPYPVFTAMEGA